MSSSDFFLLTCEQALICLVLKRQWACSGMELYPRIGKSFDIKTWTNCRMGMMGWAVLTLCWAGRQLQHDGHLADSMAVSVVLMQLYIFKFFLCALVHKCLASPACETHLLVLLPISRERSLHWSGCSAALTWTIPAGPLRPWMCVPR